MKNHQSSKAQLRENCHNLITHPHSWTTFGKRIREACRYSNRITTSSPCTLFKLAGTYYILALWNLLNWLVSFLLFQCSYVKHTGTKWKFLASFLTSYAGFLLLMYKTPVNDIGMHFAHPSFTLFEKCTLQTMYVFFPFYNHRDVKAWVDYKFPC